MANELRFLDGDLLFVGGELAMSEDCCCEETICDFEGTPPTDRLFIASNTCGFSPSATGVGLYGTYADFVADVLEPPVPNSSGTICWMWWADPGTDLDNPRFMITYSVHTGGNVSVEYWTWNDFTQLWTNASGDTSNGPITAWSELSGLVTSCGTISLI